jgi:ribose/xylose/arabinose/galactoside ABC-type transport system permease subunit
MNNETSRTDQERARSGASSCSSWCSSRSPASIWSLSDSAFMDLDNMLLLLKQSAPIGIIALGMTVIMINGNIDLSVGATYALAASSCSTA